MIRNIFKENYPYDIEDVKSKCTLLTSSQLNEFDRRLKLLNSEIEDLLSDNDKAGEQVEVKKSQEQLSSSLLKEISDD